MTTTGPGEVSAREAEVLEALGARLSNAEIASRLHISVRTVESHVSSLLRKYGVADRRALAALAGGAAPAEAVPPPRPAAPPGRMAGLPAALTSFVGRERERAAVLAAFGESRLVTLLGPGGVGKTRLAAVAAGEAAPSFPAGGAFVDLVPVGGGFVAQAVAAALGVTERPRQPLEDAVAERLGRGRSLLVLDNCEHLLDAVAGFVERTLSVCPGARVLVTSRERLGVPGERVVPVAPLPPGSDAERLFLDRAAAADPGFTADPAVVAELCARLDGMPLAIELAAARSASLGADGLLATLDDVLRLLAGGRGAVERHRSLRAVIGWSHDLLGEEERTLFRRLAVFTGGFDLDAAVAVTRAGGRGPVADVLGRLVDKSLVVRRGGESRWRLLETVRAFAADRLAAAGETDETRRRHLEWATAVATALADRQAVTTALPDRQAVTTALPDRTAGATALPGRPADATALSGQGPDGRRDDFDAGFDAVADDLRAALAGSPPGPGETPHRLARALGRLCYARRFLTESLDHYREAAERAPHPGEAARDLRSAADGAHAVAPAGHHAFELLLASAGRARAAGDGDGVAVALASAVVTANRFSAGFSADVPHERLSALLEEAAAAGDRGDPVVAALLAAAAAWNAGREKMAPDPGLAAAAAEAARATGDPVLVSGALDAVSTAAATAGRLREAYRVTRERLSLLAAMSRDDPRSAPEVTDTYNMAATYAVATGDLRTALETARSALEDDLLGGHSYLSESSLVLPLALTGEFDEALRRADGMWDGWERAGGPVAGWMSPAVAAVALVHGLRGDDHRYRFWRARATQVSGGPRNHATFAAFADARVAVHTGRFGGAAGLVELVFTDFPQGRYQTYARAAGAELAVAAGLPDAAERLASASAVAGENDWAAACLARAEGRRSGDGAALAASVAGWERAGARFERACTLLLLPDRAAEGRAELAALGCPAPA